MISPTYQDHWTLTPADADVQTPKGAAQPVMDISTLEVPEPLGDQFGVEAPLTVPEPLHDLVFGNPDPTDAEIAAAGGAVDRVPPMQTFAILDAAKVINLTETLSGSGLEHQCLFKGAAFEDLKEVAPWIVRLEENMPFTRNLFTMGDAGWHLWGRQAGIIVRARADLKEMWAHFRKFTKVQDDTGAWFFFRFWDTSVARIYFGGVSENLTRTAQFLCLSSGAPIELIVEDGPNLVHRMRLTDRSPKSSPSRTVTFDDADHHLIREANYHALETQISNWLSIEYPDHLAAIDPKQRRGIAHHVVTIGRQLDLKMKEDFSFLAQMMATAGAWFLHDGCPAELQKILTDKDDQKAQRLADVFATMHAKTPQSLLMERWAEVQAYLADIPPEERVSAQRFSAFSRSFLEGSGDAVTAVLAGTKARLDVLGVTAQTRKGQALVLALIYGPRFFEDPFHPWAGQPIEDAIDAAWRSAVGSTDYVK